MNSLLLLLNIMIYYLITIKNRTYVAEQQGFHCPRHIHPEKGKQRHVTHVANIYLIYILKSILGCSQIKTLPEVNHLHCDQRKPDLYAFHL